MNKSKEQFYCQVRVLSFEIMELIWCCSQLSEYYLQIIRCLSLYTSRLLQFILQTENSTLLNCHQQQSWYSYYQKPLLSIKYTSIHVTIQVEVYLSVLVIVLTVSAIELFKNQMVTYNILKSNCLTLRNDNQMSSAQLINISFEQIKIFLLIECRTCLY